MSNEDEIFEIKYNGDSTYKVNGQKLRNMINGALKNQIHSHGAITPEWIGSATKRIIQNLKGDFRSSITNNHKENQ